MFQLLGHPNHDSADCFSYRDTPHPGGSGEALEEALERLRRTVWGQKHREEKVAILQACRTKCADLSVYAVALPPGPKICSLPWSTVPCPPPTRRQGLVQVLMKSCKETPVPPVACPESLQGLPRACSGTLDHELVECFSYSDIRTMILQNVSAIGTSEP